MQMARPAAHSMQKGRQSIKQTSHAENKRTSRYGLPSPEALHVSLHPAKEITGGGGSLPAASPVRCDYFRMVWLQHNTCLHNGTVFPGIPTPKQHMANGDFAMLWLI